MIRINPLYSDSSNLWWLRLLKTVLIHSWRRWRLNFYFVVPLGCDSDCARKGDGFVIVACFRLICGRKLDVVFVAVSGVYMKLDLGFFRVGGQFHLLCCFEGTIFAIVRSSTLLGLMSCVLLLCVSPVRVCFDGLAPSALYCSSKIIDMLRNKSYRLEMVMHLLSVVDANGGCRCYRVGGARGAQTHWLTIPRSDFIWFWVTFWIWLEIVVKLSVAA